MAQAAVERMRETGAAAGTATVRFDAPGGPGGARSFRFRGLRSVLRAERVDEVVAVLDAVERAVADGLHAAGFVAYEAAPAFDPALVTHPPDPRLPLAWFAIYESRDDVHPTYDSAEGDAELGAWSIDVPESEYLDRVE
ncbi:MAG TPA: hypothetical protein VEQ60_02700, partial [Longimicrobium sp.]|nr:hypothetical protein [Longimicrobium sp.]